MHAQAHAQAACKMSAMGPGAAKNAASIAHADKQAAALPSASRPVRGTASRVYALQACQQPELRPLPSFRRRAIGARTASLQLPGGVACSVRAQQAVRCERAAAGKDARTRALDWLRAQRIALRESARREVPIAHSKARVRLGAHLLLSARLAPRRALAPWRRRRAASCRAAGFWLLCAAGALRDRRSDVLRRSRAADFATGGTPRGALRTQRWRTARWLARQTALRWVSVAQRHLSRCRCSRSRSRFAGLPQAR